MTPLRYQSDVHTALSASIANASSWADVMAVWDGYVKQYPEHAKYLDQWLLSKLFFNAPFDMSQPWVTFAALEWLNANVQRHFKVFEWGMGGSSLYFSQRVALLRSAESDDAWYKKVIAKLQTLAKTGTVTLDQTVGDSTFDLIPAKLCPPNTVSDDFSTQADVERKISFEDYVKHIEKSPDEFYDIIFVDGRARNGCMTRAPAKLKSGGFLILDNSERQSYRTTIERLQQTTMKGWQELDFVGPGPHAANIGWATTVWIKP